jgi:anaerobic magnesium-protoporphyrin IX monomethyl ester cyclase
MTTESPLADAASSLASRAPGRPLRVVLVSFYNYEAHAARIFHPLLEQRGHDVHSIFFKNYFTYQVPTQKEEDMVVELIERLRPDLVGMSVWSTYYQLAGRLSDRIKASVDPVVVWGGIHAQTRPEDCLQHADLVCRSEGEYVLAELTDRLSLGRGYDDLRGCWVKVDGQPRCNSPRLLLDDLGALPTGDVTTENKYYLGRNAWRDVPSWDARAVSYDIMAVRGCPFECTFCIHNFTRSASEGLGTYLRRRSVDHVITELRDAKRARPRLRTVAFSDDIFGPPRPWLTEFCRRYKQEIGLPFAIYSFPRMVDEEKFRMMRDAGLWAVTMGIQSGSERIRRECYERETSNEEILGACRTLARLGIIRNLDFIGDNPYETEADRRETVDLLCQLPKPFYFNYFSLTYFPGVDLTEWALRDGFIRREDVEDIAQKGYQLYGISLVDSRSPEQLRWDVAYSMAVHGFPRHFIHRMLEKPSFNREVYRWAAWMRRIRSLSRRKMVLIDRLRGRPNLAQQFDRNTNRDGTSGGDFVQPNIDSSPLAAQIGPPSCELPVVDPTAGI